MSRNVKTLLAGAAVIAALAAGPVAFAGSGSGSWQRTGGTMQDGLMGQDGMNGQMSAMMARCAEMMRAMTDEARPHPRPQR